MFWGLRKEHLLSLSSKVPFTRTTNLFNEDLPNHVSELTFPPPPCKDPIFEGLYELVNGI